MKRIILVALMAVIALLALCTSCNDTDAYTLSCSELLGPFTSIDGVQIAIIDSDSYYYADQEREVRAALEYYTGNTSIQVIDIIAGYANGHLLSAKVYYRVLEPAPAPAPTRGIIK